MRGGAWGVGVSLLLVMSSLALAAPPRPSSVGPSPTDSTVIRVNNGTSVTVWERTTDLNELTFDVPTLMGPGGTFTSLASEQYTFTSDGVYFKIHCFRNSFDTGTRAGNNIAGARLDGVPGYPSGLWATIIVSYVVGYGGTEDSRFNALGDNLSDHTYMGDQVSELVLGFTVDVPSNHPPAITSFTASVANEGAPVTFDVVADDLDGDPLTYDYDFDGDGMWDVTGGANTATRTFGDDFSGTANVRVSDGTASTQASTAVLVRNVAPSLDTTRIYAATDITLRVAGEKWHDVRMDVWVDGVLMGTATVVRHPGSPDDQRASIGMTRISLFAAVGIVLTYTPDDDPVNGQPNGGNPAWVIFAFPDGSEARIHHTFNVRHPETWTWTLDDLTAYLVGHPILFESTASDVGSDDLTFAWDFGDGSTTVATTYFNDGVGPDPFPSPDVNPIAATDVTNHAFLAAGMYIVTLAITDDDGGAATSSWTLPLG